MLLKSLCNNINALLGNTLIDMNMLNTTLFTLIDIDNSIEQLRYTSVIIAHNRHHRHTHHLTQKFIIKCTTRSLQHIILTQRNNYALIHIDKFRCKIETLLESRCSNQIEHNIVLCTRYMRLHLTLLCCMRGERTNSNEF